MSARTRRKFPSKWLRRDSQELCRSFGIQMQPVLSHPTSRSHLSQFPEVLPVSGSRTHLHSIKNKKPPTSSLERVQALDLKTQAYQENLAGCWSPLAQPEPPGTTLAYSSYDKGFGHECRPQHDAGPGAEVTIPMSQHSCRRCALGERSGRPDPPVWLPLTRAGYAKL